MKRREGEKQMSGWGGGGCMKMKRSKRTDRVWGGVHKERRGGVCGHTCFCSIEEIAANAAQLVFF